ncbi:hypothetical protein E1B28_006748 [Marasmius oreades]|uniref:Fatty acid desaturase domain-containing protein n=1 Tax=Marasmius oreades TaxID=181124 RepID=A0A9P7UWR6_9AGAR|nr:uncharacterized protein E1B28_006748 [Marasmius oreades]KAG7096068.1 hypothetical protein E1B28_006748 [Marasmius oreades]
MPLMLSLSFLSTFLQDGPEYEKRKRTPFVPPDITLSEVHAVVPQHLRSKDTLKGLSVVARDVFLAFSLYTLSEYIPTTSSFLAQRIHDTLWLQSLFKWSLWATYWQCQGILFTSLWCLSHESSHGNLSSRGWINDGVGFCLHTSLLVPYFPWKSSHIAHHKATVSLERDTVFVPPTRSHFKLPPEAVARTKDYHEILEETPIYTFYRMFLMQIFGLLFYFVFDARGSPKHPPGTNHFNPYSTIFKPRERIGVVASDAGLLAMIALLYLWSRNVGFGQLARIYLLPWLLTNHWIVMLTYLHHADPTVPYYRRGAWTFLRGALATVDRPLLGWIGRVFFHNVSHNHVSHHIFSDIPFYNQPEVTARIRTVLKDHYNFDSTNTFRALYRTFTQCEFVEDEGDVVFYKNREGKPAREVAQLTGDSR